MPGRPGGSRQRAAIAFAAFVALGCCTALPNIARAQSVGVESDPFVHNRTRLSVGAGLSNSGTETYMQLGVGVGYYIADGLELGVNTDIWLIGDPTVVNVTPGLLYVFHMVRVVKPYVGAFYRHAFVFDARDLDSIGGRAGLYLVSGRVFFGAGVVYEHWLNCGSSRFIDCDEVYPEATIGVTF
jgi:hypothetical protein